MTAYNKVDSNITGLANRDLACTVLGMCSVLLRNSTLFFIVIMAETF